MMRSESESCRRCEDHTDKQSPPMAEADVGLAGSPPFDFRCACVKECAKDPESALYSQCAGEVGDEKLAEHST